MDLPKSTVNANNTLDVDGSTKLAQATFTYNIFIGAVTKLYLYINGPSTSMLITL